MKPHTLWNLQISSYQHKYYSTVPNKRNSNFYQKEMGRRIMKQQRRHARWTRNNAADERAKRRKNRAYRNWLRNLNVGDIVGPCDDGKSSRKRRGVVVRKLNKGVVYVRFVPYGGEGQEVVVKFKNGEGYSGGPFGFTRLKEWTAEDVWAVKVFDQIDKIAQNVQPSHRPNPNAMKSIDLPVGKSANMVIIDDIAPPRPINQADLDSLFDTMEKS